MSSFHSEKCLIAKLYVYRMTISDNSVHEFFQDAKRLSWAADLTSFKTQNFMSSSFIQWVLILGLLLPRLIHAEELCWMMSGLVTTQYQV